MTSQCLNRMPCAFFGHGGGPLPLLGQQPEVAAALGSYAASLPATPKAVLVVTAHWVADTVSVASGPSPPLIFDYGGFPPESYRYTYPAPGDPQLAQRVHSLLTDAGVAAKQDPKRGWDHGVFVPLKLMFPDASVPVVSLSLQASLDPAQHIRVGRALAPLRDEGVLILGSGMSFHNFGYFFARDPAARAAGVRHSNVWNEYLVDTLVKGGLTREEQLRRMEHWSTGPSATEAHPLGQEDHLLPLHVVLGAAGEGAGVVCSVVGAAGARAGAEAGADTGLNAFADSNFEWR